VLLSVVVFVFVVVVPLVLGGSLVLARQNRDIALTERRTVGVEYGIRDDAVIARLRRLRAGLLLHGSISLADRLEVEAALTRLYDFNSGAARGLALEKRLERLQNAWTAVPERGRAVAAVDAALGEARDLQREIYERGDLRGTPDGRSTADLIDAFAVAFPSYESVADEMRTLALVAPSRPGVRTGVALANAILASQGDGALAGVRRDLARAAAADQAAAPALAALAPVEAAWSRFKAAADKAASAGTGARLFRFTDEAHAAVATAARRALAAELSAQRSRLALLEAALWGTLLFALSAGALLVWAVRARDRSDLQRLEAEAERLSADAENRRMRELLALTEARFDAVFERAAFGVAILDVEGHIVRRNAALARLAPEADAAGVGAAAPEFAELAAGRREAYTVELAPTREKSKRWLEAVVSLVRDDAGEPLFIVSMVTDATERREAAERLAYAATHDLAVGLPNRAFLFERMRASFFDRPDAHSVAGVVFIDFDGFKLINDNLGHIAGERLLSEAARRLSAAVEHHDLVARFGGDEFVVLLQGRESREALIADAKRMLVVLEEPISLDERDAYVTVNVGLAVVDHSYESVEEIVRDADTAMYAAKTSGRTRFAVFDAAMRAHSRRRMELAAQLRRAIERDQLHLLYQPITSLTTGRIQSFEVLLRWEHPELGLVNPAEFVPIAEEVGLIVPIGRWVFERACAQLARWREKRGAGDFQSLHLSVNASVLELLQPGYCEFVERTVARHALNPGDIVLEITESTILRSGRFAVATLDRLRQAGLRLAIDDFGTGYSALRYLQEFPFDYLKIDGSFVRGKDGGLASEPIVTMLVALGKAVGVQVIAEGAETREQVERLRALGCGAVQGFLFGSPSAAALVPGMLRAPVAS
jgi:diguanylate cyclase (GGDEF)-like protein